MFSLATRRALAPACHWPAHPCFGDDGDDGHRMEKKRKAPPAAGLFGERSRADSLPFALPPARAVRKIRDCEDE